MRRARLVWRVVWLVLAAVLLETSIVGVPGSLRTQYDAIGPNWIVRIVVGILALLCALVAVGPSRLREWRDHFRGGGLSSEALSAHLAKELRTGYELRTKARMAHPGTDELFEACQAFMDWGLAVNEWMIANTPLYYDELPQTAPWAIHGKGKALELMDKRLRAHAEIAKKLGARDS